LTKLGLVTDRDLAGALSEVLLIPLVTASDFPDAPILESELSRRFLKESRVIALAVHGDGILVAMVDPLDADAADAISFSTGKSVLRRVSLPADFEAAYERIYGDGRSEISQIAEAAQTRHGDAIEGDIERLKDVASEAPVIRLVNLLITRAVEARASDIHREPTDGELRVRYRIDGMLHDMEAPPQGLSAPIISRIKIMARLNIAERRLAQDGRIWLSRCQR
jgi:general secretion pathway protein E